MSKCKMTEGFENNEAHAASQSYHRQSCTFANHSAKLQSIFRLEYT